MAKITYIAHTGAEHVIEGLEPMDAADGIAAFTPAQQRILRALRRTHFVKLLEKH